MKNKESICNCPTEFRVTFFWHGNEKSWKTLLNNEGLELGMNSPPLKGSLIDTCSGMRNSLWQYKPNWDYLYNRMPKQPFQSCIISCRLQPLDNHLIQEGKPGLKDILLLTHIPFFYIVLQWVSFVSFSSMHMPNLGNLDMEALKPVRVIECVPVQPFTVTDTIEVSQILKGL